MKQRLMTAIPLAIVALLAFLGPGMLGILCFSVLAAGMLTGGVHECFSMVPGADRRRHQIWVTLTGCLYALAAARGCAIHEVFVLLLLLLGLCALLFVRGPSREQVSSWLSSVGIFLYVVWTLSFFVRIYCASGCMAGLGGNGAKTLLFVIAVTKFGDIGAYAAGSLTARLPRGNHKLAPALSPKKSWEGLAGGCIASVLVALWLCGLACWADGSRVFSFTELLLFGVCAAVVGLLGDLLESAWKRSAGLKDSGKIPGLGGVLDVLDSLIFMAPLAYVWIGWKLTAFR